MVKFSVAGKKRSAGSVLSHRCSSSSDDDDDEEEEGHLQSKRVEVETGESSSSSFIGKENGIGGGDLITVRLDPDVLDCSICYEPLAPPVFQCSNGHISCSTCCRKMNNKCHSCSCSLGSGPSGRCLGVEKILESIRITCPHAQNGCQESFNYSQFHTHKESCMHSPCSCPIPDCNFEGSLQQLSSHCKFDHRESVIPLESNSALAISLDRDKPITILHGSDSIGVVYLLHNTNSPSVGGCFITLTAIHPGIRKGDATYELIAKCGDSTLQLKSSIASTKQWTGVSPSKDFLLVPHDFFYPTGLLDLKVFICNEKLISVILGMVQESEYYDILGVSCDAPASDIKKAYYIHQGKTCASR